MALKSLAITILLSAMTSACDSQKPTVAQDPPPTNGGASDTQFGHAPDSVFFMLRRTPCFGTCPAYTITILGDGRATYNGSAHVERIGEYTGHVEPEAMSALYERAKRIDFFGFKDRYDGQVTDLPSTVIRVSANGQDKQVVGRVSPPAAFKNYAAYADSLLAGVNWVPKGKK